jgi:hypothetical protein
MLSPYMILKGAWLILKGCLGSSAVACVDLNTWNHTAVQ